MFAYLKSKRCNQAGFSLPGVIIAGAVGAISTLAVTKSLSNSEVAGQKVSSMIDRASVKALILQNVSCAETFSHSTSPSDPACFNGQYIPLRSDTRGTLVDARGSLVGKWVVRARCTSGGIDLRIASPLPSQLANAAARDFGASSSLFRNDEINSALRYDWNHPGANMLADVPPLCGHLFNSPVAQNQPLVCPQVPNPGGSPTSASYSYLVGVNFQTGELICDSHGQRSNNLVSNTIVNLNSYFNGPANEYYEVRKSSREECALLREMRCPPGYYQFGYEALQPTAGGNCRVQCKSF